MTQTVARINKAGKHFEILVDLDQALNYKKNKQGSSVDFLEFDEVFSDSGKGEVSSREDLQECFGTKDINEIANKIVAEGEIQDTTEHRNAEQEKVFKQIVDFLARNAINPQTGNPHTTERIKNALEQANINIQNKSVESQISDIIEKVNGVIPIKIQTKKVKITIPAIHVGRAYGVINPYKSKEEWLSNGNLEVTVNVPAGLIMDFYDKLNSVTHGSAITEEITE